MYKILQKAKININPDKIIGLIILNLLKLNKYYDNIVICCAILIMPILFGLVSLFLGQDISSDLRNYHIYNPWALLNGRVGFDLAPASMQTYFNPLIDVPYFILTENYSARFAAFMMGVFHGLCFIPLYFICRELVGTNTSRIIPFVLALVGCLGPTFYYQVGASMGDNTTAIFGISALCLVLYFSSTLHVLTKKSVFICACIGLIMGIGVGCKLTNSPFAVGLAASLLVLNKTQFRTRLTFTMIFGLGVIVGMAITGGFWFMKMWMLFQNPFFPQFNNIFRSDLTSSVGIVDARWGPKTIIEGLIWPFIFTFHPSFVSEAQAIQILQPFAYVVSIIYILKYVASFVISSFVFKPLSEIWILFLVFFLVSYFTWLKVFSFGRYLVVIDVLLPVLVYVGLRGLINSDVVRNVIVALIVSGLVISSVANDDWGRSEFSDSLLQVDVPLIQEPNRSAVIFAGSQPKSWLIPKFPSDLVFVSVGSMFMPSSQGYEERFQEIINDRKGDLFLLVDAVTKPHLDKLEDSRFLAAINWAMSVTSMSSNNVCSGVSLLARNLLYSKRLEGKIVVDSGDFVCKLVIHPRKIDFHFVNLQELEQAREKLYRYRLNFRDDDCVLYEASIGKRSIPYRFCKVYKVS